MELRISRRTVPGIALFLAASVFLGGCAVLFQDHAKPRGEISLDGSGWRVWLDEKAGWTNDILYAPGQVPALDTLPVNQPTGGWDMPGKAGIAAATPASIEQLFARGEASWLYHGVSWFAKTVRIPVEWKGKVVRLTAARARLRVELYVNRKLAGYDLCCETPVEFDISRFLQYGQSNEIAIRLTNPGGSRGFDDCPQVYWDKNGLPSGRDFAGLDTVAIVATPPVYISDVFVMNQLPANGRNVEVRVTIRNTTSSAVKYALSAKIHGTRAAARRDIEIKPGDNVVAIPLTAPEAKIWDVEHPNLYTCSVALSGNRQQAIDTVDQRFGFRVFEVRADRAGKSCFYLNGKRFRHRSAIDWGFYAHTGFSATEAMVRRSVLAAREIGHNGINLHRHIGEYRMLDAADSIGLILYEEPGGLHQWQGDDPIIEGTLADKIIQEKVRRMVLRDRNHPSLVIHNLSNEDNCWDKVREKALNTIHSLDPSTFVSNSSGDTSGKYGKGPRWQPSGPNNHFRPYEAQMRSDFQDDHTVGSSAMFDEYALTSHAREPDSDLFYYGEVYCYTGPANWWLVAEQQGESQKGLSGALESYDDSAYRINHDKTGRAFSRWNLGSCGSRNIKSPADVSRQAGRSLMYKDGRLSQRIMSNNHVDGYAINGWSAHSYFAAAGDLWESAIVDEGRNLKGPAGDYAWWVRPCQVAIFRTNGTCFKPGDTAQFEVRLVNEGRIPAGEYRLRFTATDGIGMPTGYTETRNLSIKGGDTFAQKAGSVSLLLGQGWHAGQITLCASLEDEKGRVVADGREQVLLRNRPSFAGELKNRRIAVVNWLAAETALGDAQTGLLSAESAAVVIAGSTTADSVKMLNLARSGKTLIIKFDKDWAKLLFEQGILSAPVTQWGGKQTGHWKGNGWGYLDHFVGNQTVPSKTTIGTSDWQTPGDPVGFYPFESRHRLTAYGLYMARPGGQSDSNSLLVLLGAIDYGRGKIVLAPSYPVDAGNAFNDLLFFNLVSRACRNEW